MIAARIFAFAAAGALLAACGGGSAGTAPVQPQGSSTQTLAVTLNVPGRSVTTAKNKRIPLYTSIDTRGIGIEIRAHSAAYSGAPSLTPTFAAAIAPGASGNAACTAAGSNGAYTCTVYVPGVPVGYDDLRVALWNAAPAGCTALGATCNFNDSADRVLSFGVLTNYAILAGIGNTLNYTLSPVVDSASVALDSGITDGIASNIGVSVTALDAHGNIILGSDAYVDANGNPVTLSLSIGNNAGSSLAFSTASSFTSGGAGNTATLHYDGTATFPVSGSVPYVHLTSTQPLNGTLVDKTLLVTGKSSFGAGVPAAPQYNGHAAVASPNSAASGSDGKLYVLSWPDTVYQVTPGAGSITPAAVSVTLDSPPSDIIGGLATGLDTYLWYTDSVSGKVYRQAPGTGGANNASSGPIVGSWLGAIAAGPDGDMYFPDASHGTLDSIAPASITTVNTLSAPNVNNDMIAAGVLATAGSTEQAACVATTSHQIVACDAIGSGFLASAFTVPNSSTATAMAIGPDHLLYVTSADKHVYALYDNAGALTLVFTYPASATLTAAGSSIASDRSGAVWITEGTGALARIGVESIGNPPATPGTFTEYTLPAVFNASSTSANLHQIVLGSDGNLWISDTGLGQFEQVVP